MEKPKIAILTIRNSYEFGGVLTCVKQLYKFCERYFDPTVFYLSFDPQISANLKSFKFSNQIRKTVYFGMKAIEIGAKWAFWEPGHYSYSLPLWEEALKGYDYFLVKSGSCVAAYPLVKLNKKFALWVGTSYEDDRAQRKKHLPYFRKIVDFFAQFKMKKIENNIFKKADFIFPISKITKNRIDQLIGFRRDNIAICGFPIETKVENKKISKDKNIIAVGRFSDPRKNFDMLMRAFKQIYENFPESRLYVIGSKPYQVQLEKYSSFSYYKNILFTGNLDQQQLKQFYEISDLMLITSYQEGLGIIGLEAMSFGLPVISTDCGGVSDYIVNGKNGFLVDINDDKSMAFRAIEILSSYSLHKDLSEFALIFLKNHFSSKRFESIIQYGLINVYPELKKVFEKYDSNNLLSAKEKINEYQV